jgi:hypothetical protein
MRILTLISLFSILIGTPLLALTALEAWYIPMCFLIAIVGHGFYGISFYFFAYRRTRAFILLEDLIENVGVRDIPSLSDSTGLTASAAREFVDIMIRKKYLSGFTLDKECIVKQ